MKKNIRIKNHRKRDEDIIHYDIGKWLLYNRENLIRKKLIYYTYSPAGEERNVIVGANLKRKGVMKGDADYRLEFIKKDVQHTLYIEVKAGKNKLTKEQAEIFEARKNIKNTFCIIARSLDDFIRAVDDFLKDDLIK